MIELVLRLKGYHYARLLAFLSFFSLIVVAWWVLVGDVRFSDGDVIFAEVVFMVMGLFSALIASTEGEKKP